MFQQGEESPVRLPECSLKFVDLVRSARKVSICSIRLEPRNESIQAVTIAHLPRSETDLDRLDAGCRLVEVSNRLSNVASI
jgi:hypothetical protein